MKRSKKINIEYFIKDLKNTKSYKSIINIFNPVSIFIGGSVAENLYTDSSDIDIFVILKNDKNFSSEELTIYYNTYKMTWDSWDVNFIFRTIDDIIKPTNLFIITGFAKRNIFLYGKNFTNDFILIKYGAFLITQECFSSWPSFINQLLYNNNNNNNNEKPAGHYIYSIILLCWKFLNKTVNYNFLLLIKDKKSFSNIEILKIKALIKEVKKQTSILKYEILVKEVNDYVIKMFS